MSVATTYVHTLVHPACNDWMSLAMPHPLQVAQGLVEVDSITGASQVNIKALHRLLVDEVNQVPGLAASGKRPAVMREVHDVLVHFVKHNRVLQNVQARKDYFEGLCVNVRRPLPVLLYM